MVTSRRLSRRELLLTVSGTSAVAGGLVGTTLASFADSEADGGSLETDTWAHVEGRVTYTDSDTLYSFTQATGGDGYGVSDAQVLGPVDDRFDNTEYDIPVVDSGATLSLVAKDGSTRTPPTGSTAPRTKQSLLATATWNGNPIAVYYATGSEIYRTSPGATEETLVEAPSDGAKAVLGAGDIDGDGTDELAFVGGSQTVQYVVPGSGTVESTGTSPGGGYGAGEPVAIDGYGTVVPAVNGSGGLGLLGSNGWVEKTLTAGSTAKKCPVHGCDFDDDGAVEIVFVGYSNQYLKYVDDVGGANDVKTVSDSSGNPIPADTKQGIH